MTKASKRYWAAYDRITDADFAREEQHFDEHGTYSRCAGRGCQNECNPSNVHASGKKFCDECWEEAED